MLLGLNQTEQIQLIILAIGLLTTLLILRLIGRPLIAKLIRRISRNILFSGLQYQNIKIARWLERGLGLISAAIAGLIAAAVVGVDVEVATNWLRILGSNLLTWLGLVGLRILFILILAYIANKTLLQLVPLAVRGTMLRGKQDMELEEASKRANALIQVGYYVITSTVGLLAAFMILSELNINIGPILAGVGVVGIALGFGAQNLVRDVIAGIFILAEDQYGVGDVASVGGKTGLVEAVNLRRTLLRDLDGIMHVIPNGEISTASNYTKGYSRVNLDISVAYKEDLDRVIRVLNRVGGRLAEDDYFGPLIMEPPRALRVNSFDDSGITIKVLGVTKPIRQWEVMGELRRRIKREFDAEGIEIPFPQQTIHWANGAHPASAPAPANPTVNSDIQAMDTPEEHFTDPWVIQRAEKDRERKLNVELESKVAPGTAGEDARKYMNDMLAMWREKSMGLFFDLDGTLAPIAPRPDAVAITPAIRQILSEIASHASVTILTGRSVSDAQQIIGLSNVTYAGNHGIEWFDKGVHYLLPEAQTYEKQMKALYSVLQRDLVDLTGVAVEDKGVSVSVHYRLAPIPHQAREAVISAIAHVPESKGLKIREGKMIIEVRPPIDADKGTALTWMINNRKLRSALVLGDDLTDVDAFTALTDLKLQNGTKGFNIAVLGPNTPGEVLIGSDLYLPNTEAVEIFLARFVEICID